METKRISLTLLEVEGRFYWFEDPDDLDLRSPLDISNIKELSLEVPILDGRHTTVRLHGPFVSRVEFEHDMMAAFDLATWGTVH